MDISSILGSSSDTTSFLQQKDKTATASAFKNYFLDASTSSSTSSGTSTSGSGSTSKASGSDALQAFMRYAKETPAQRMFDNWLQGQGVTQEQFNAMTPAQKQKLVNEFETQMKAKLGSETRASLAAATAS
jgi:hypothetical protein